MKVRARLYSVLPVAVIATLAVMYGLTLQTDINGHSIDFLIDVGELQIALSTWGVTHPTGYALYTILGNVLADLGRLVGVPPAAATSALSWFAAVGAIIIIYVFVYQATRSMAAALAATVSLGLCPAVWLAGVVTELDTLTLLYSVALFYAAWRAQQGDRVSPLLLAALATLAFGHHRTLVALIPGLLVLVWEPGRAWLASLRRPQGPGILRGIAAPLVVLVAPFALYAYVPLRIIQHAPWIYDQQRYGLSQPLNFSLSWFINYSLAHEYTTYVQIPTSIAQLVAYSEAMVRVWIQQLGAIGLAAGLLGLLIALFGRHRRLSLAMMLIILYDFGWGVLYYAKDIERLITPSYAAWVVGTGLLVGWVGERAGRLAKRAGAATVAGWGLAALIVAAPLIHLPAEYTQIHTATKDPSGRETIRAAQRIPDSCPTVLSLWGIDYFAYYYAKLSTHELSCLTVLPLHSDIRQNWQQGQRVFVVSHFFYQTTVDQLEQRFGRLYLRSAGYGNVELGSQPATAPDQEIGGSPTDMGGVITLLSDHLQRSSDGKTLYLTLYWKADGAQRQDYSVFVHVSDKSAISGPADIVSQSDSVHPVYGWYPTSRWVAGEVVRDDYVITENPARPAQLITVGLYQSAGGAFTNLGSRDIIVSDGQ